MDINKENSIPFRVKTSPSLFSLRSILNKRQVTEINVSQPALDDSSRLKLMHKVRESPSMMSLNGSLRKPEFVVENERRVVNDLLKYTSTHQLEDNIQDLLNDKLHYDFIDLSCVDPQDILHKLKIHNSLRNCTSNGSQFVHIEEFKLERVNDGGGKYICAIGYKNIEGIRLDMFEPLNDQESCQVIYKLAQLLAAAETQFSFEHRNLHPQNVFVHRSEFNNKISHITVANCDIGRLYSVYTPLDSVKFYEFRTPILSEMRQIVRDPSAFYPITNVLWLNYIARYLYNIRPSSEMKRICYILNNKKWKMRRKPRSANDVVSQIGKLVLNGNKY